MCRCDLCSCGDVSTKIPLSILGKAFYLFITYRTWFTEGDDRRQVVSIVFLGVTLALHEILLTSFTALLLPCWQLLEDSYLQHSSVDSFMPHNLRMGPRVEENRLTLYSSQRPAKELKSALACTAHQMGKSLLNCSSRLLLCRSCWTTLSICRWLTPL